MDERIANWLVSGDTGISSLAIVAKMNGASVDPTDYPRDPSDLGRCIRLLAIMPSYRQRLHEMGIGSPMWENLVQNWDELVSLYNQATPDGRATACYNRMKELIESGLERAFPKTFKRYAGGYSHGRE